MTEREISLMIKFSKERWRRTSCQFQPQWDIIPTFEAVAETELSADIQARPALRPDPPFSSFINRLPLLGLLWVARIPIFPSVTINIFCHHWIDDLAPKKYAPWIVPIAEVWLPKNCELNRLIMWDFWVHLARENPVWLQVRKLLSSLLNFTKRYLKKA